MNAGPSFNNNNYRVSSLFEVCGVVVMLRYEEITSSQLVFGMMNFIHYPQIKADLLIDKLNFSNHCREIFI